MITGHIFTETEMMFWRTFRHWFHRNTCSYTDQSGPNITRYNVGGAVDFSLAWQCKHNLLVLWIIQFAYLVGLPRHAGAGVTNAKKLLPKSF